MSDPRIQDEGITANQIVFSFWLPHPRDNQQLDFSRWQQTLMGVLILEVGYDPKFELGKKKRLATVRYSVSNANFILLLIM